MLILLKLNANCMQWRTMKWKKANPLSRRLLYCIWAISCARYTFQTKNPWSAKYRQGSLKEVFLTIVIYLHCLVSFHSKYVTSSQKNSLWSRRMISAVRICPRPPQAHMSKWKTRLIFILLHWRDAPAKELTGHIYSHKKVSLGSKEPQIPCLNN